MSTTESSSTAPVRRLVVDNGGYWLRAALVNDKGDLIGPLYAAPNCIATSPVYGKGLVGLALTKLEDYHSLMVRRPVDRGFIVDVSLQAHIWRAMLEDLKIADEDTVDLILTIPFASPDAVIENIRVLVVQQFRFKSVTFVSATFLVLVARAAAAELAAQPTGSATSTPLSDTPTTTRKRRRGTGPDQHSGQQADNDARTHPKQLSLTGSSGAPVAAVISTSPLGLAGTGLVVDCGFSGCTVVPYVDFCPLPESIVRTDVGGKLLTNRLKEVISFAHINLLEDAFLVNHIKETLCYVVSPSSSAFREELRLMHGERRRGLTKYALPTIRALAPVGCLLEKLPPEVNLAKERHLLQVLPLKQELCAVPEMIFSPLDANVPQLPLHAAVMLALERPGTMLKHCRFLHATLLRNVVAFGGTTRLDGMTKRLAAELQSGCTVEVRVLPSASTCPNLISSSDASVAEDFRRKPVDEAAGLVGTEALEPLIGGVYLCRHTRLLALAEQRSKVSRVDALAAAPSEERPGIRKGMWLLLRAAQLLL